MTPTVASVFLGLLSLLSTEDPCATEVEARSTRAQGGKLRALLVGIEHYEGRPEATLRGPGNDLRAVSALLRNKGFSVRCLFNSSATKTAIVRNWRSHLIGRSAPDVSIFYFAGHGQRVADEDNDEEDGYDEALMTYRSRLLTDDEIFVLTLRTPNLVVILDSCYSGSATRGAPLGGRGLAPRTSSPQTPTKAIEIPEPSDAVLLSAAHADQLALEYRIPDSGEVMGAFTFLLVEVLNAALSSGRIRSLTYEGLMREISARLPALGTTQVPLLQGPGRRVVFQNAFGREPFAFEVEPVRPSEPLRIRGGSAHGLTQGTELAVFARGRDFERLFRAGPTRSLGTPDLVRVATVAISRAYAPLPSGTRSTWAKKYRAGGLALITALPPPLRPRLRLDVRAQPVKGALEHIAPGRFELVGPTDDGDWEYWVRSVPEGDQPSCGPLFASATGRLIQILRPNGSVLELPVGPRRLPRLCISDGAEGIDATLVRALRASVARTRLLGLSPKRGERELDVRLEIEGGGRGSGEVIKLAPGQEFRIKVVNREATPVFVAILAVEPDLSIHRIFPSDEASHDQVEGHGELRLRTPFRIVKPYGPTLLKLIATSEERMDTALLEFDPSVRRQRLQRRAQGPLARRILGQAIGWTRAAALDTSEAALQGWGTASLRLSPRP